VFESRTAHHSSSSLQRDSQRGALRCRSPNAHCAQFCAHPISTLHRELHPRRGEHNERAWRWNCGRLRAEFIEAYGGKCECCGETEPEFLSLDHIFGDGARHRRQLRRGNIYRELKRLGWPKDRYRLLCYNCNIARAHGGRCPHESSERERLSPDAEADLPPNKHLADVTA
jgi:hypothetical protein